MKLSVLRDEKVPPSTVIDIDPEPTVAVACLLTVTESGVCFEIQSLGHDAIAAVCDWSNNLTLRLTQFVLVIAPTPEEASVCAVWFDAWILDITCSPPAPSIMISPSFNSVWNLVPKPVNTPPVVIVTVPVRVLSWSAYASAVKISLAPDPTLGV